MSPPSPPNHPAHVAAMAFPFSTHAAPLLAVVRRLAASFPNTTFSFFNTSQSNSSIFTDVSRESQPNVRAHDVWDGVPDGYAFTGKPQERIELFMQAAPRSLRSSLAAAEAEVGRVVTCIVTDAFFWFAAEMADEMGVPWLPFWTAGPNSLSVHFYTDLIRTHVSARGGGNEQHLLSFIPGMSKVTIQDLPEGVIFGNLGSLFSQMLHRMGLMLPRATAVLINSCEELDKTFTEDLKSRFNKLLNVGPCNLVRQSSLAQDECACLSWLGNQEEASVAYISFGSVTVPLAEELVAMAEALEGSGVPFIWSLKTNATAKLPKGFLDRTKSLGIVVPWAPQAEILSHTAVGVFVTHCGWNSVLEGIAGGVPMICRPFFGDQRLNCRMVEDVWEIGVRVEGGVLTKEGTGNCLSLVLSQEKGKRMKAKIKTLKELATEAVGHGGSSTENFKLLETIIAETERCGFTKCKDVSNAKNCTES